MGGAQFSESMLASTCDKNCDEYSKRLFSETAEEKITFVEPRIVCYGKIYDLLLDLGNDLKAMLKSSDVKSESYDVGQVLSVYLVDRKNCFLIVSTQPSKALGDAMKSRRHSDESISQVNDNHEQPSQPTLGEMVRDELDK